MKQIVTMIAVLLMGYAASAQSTSSPAIDTLTDAATEYLLQPKTKYFNGKLDGCFSVGFVGTKISGTTAGYAIIQTSIDGTNYTNLYNSSADSFALTNTSGAQAKNWYINGVKPVKVRIKVVGSGTQSTQIKGYFVTQ